MTGSLQAVDCQGRRRVNIDGKRVGAAGSVIAGIAVIHGLRTRKWRYIHTIGVVLGIAAVVAPLVKRVKSIRAGLGPETG